MLNPNFFAATCFIKFKNFKETLTQNSAFFRKFCIIIYFFLFPWTSYKHLFTGSMGLTILISHYNPPNCFIEYQKYIILSLSQIVDIPY